MTEAESNHGAAYEEIKVYVLEKTGQKVSCLNVSQVKQKLGIIEHECYNKPKSEDRRPPKCSPEKRRGDSIGTQALSNDLEIVNALEQFMAVQGLCFVVASQCAAFAI